jgi:hypothetical protein
MSEIKSLYTLFELINTTTRELAESLYTDMSCLNNVDKDINRENYNAVSPYYTGLSSTTDEEYNTEIIRDFLKYDLDTFDIVFDSDGEAQLEDIDLGENISQSFTFKDFLYSPTAEKHNINNNPTETHKQNLVKLAAALEKVQKRFGKKIVITSGYRSKALNSVIKGASATSDHCYGAAADIRTVSDAEAANLHLLKTICDLNEEHKTNTGEVLFRQIIWEFGSNNGPSWIHVAIPHSKATKRAGTRYTRAYGSSSKPRYVDTQNFTPFKINV